MLCIAMLCVMDRMTELGMHVRGAVRNGVSAEEISVVLIMVGWVWGLASRILSGTSHFRFLFSFWAFCGLRSLGEGIWEVWIEKCSSDRFADESDS
jgi:hypothetical protein